MDFSLRKSKWGNPKWWSKPPINISSFSVSTRRITLRTLLFLTYLRRRGSPAGQEHSPRAFLCLRREQRPVDSMGRICRTARLAEQKGMGRVRLLPSGVGDRALPTWGIGRLIFWERSWLAWGKRGSSYRGKRSKGRDCTTRSLQRWARWGKIWREDAVSGVNSCSSWRIWWGRGG